MNVGLRRVNPLRLAGIGGATILMLMGVGLHPPDGGFEPGVPLPGVSTGDETAAPSPVYSDPDRSVLADQAISAITHRPSPSKAGGRGHAQPPGKGEPAAGGGATGRGGAEDGGGAGNGGGPGNGVGVGGGPPGIAGAEGNAVQTVSCPSVEDRLPAIPSAAAAEVDQNLSLLRQQIADANARLAQLAADPVDDPNFVQNTVLGPLRDNRVATIDRIAIAIGRYTTRPSNLAELAPCRLSG